MIRRALFAIALGVAALAASAQVYTCARSVSGDSFNFACTLQAAPTPPLPPVVPVTPPPPPPPPPAPADSAACPPSIASNPFLCNLWLSNPIGPGAGPAGGTSVPTGAGDGGGFDRPSFTFRNGDILRVPGPGSRSVIATTNAQIGFSVGNSGGGGSKRVTVTINGRVVDEEGGVDIVTPKFLVHTGDVIVLTITGDGVFSARLEIQG